MLWIIFSLMQLNGKDSERTVSILMETLLYCLNYHKAKPKHIVKVQKLPRKIGCQPFNIR